MAVMIPESISYLKNATGGEKRVFKILKETLPSSYIVWFDLRVNNRYPDFIILGPDLGIVILEVKDWQIGSIESADANYFELKTMGKKINPLKQARKYMFNIVDELKKDKKLKNNNDYLKFSYGHGVVFTRIAKKSFLNSPFVDTINKDCVLFQDELKMIEDNFDEIYLKQKLKSMIPVKYDFEPLNRNMIDRIRGNLFKEVKLSQDNESIFKVMNINQEQYAKGLGYGHRVIRGVAGSGKTVVLICRAKYLAQLHKDWKILVLCFNKTLSTFLRTSIIDDGIDNVEVIHFHGLINNISKQFNLKTPIFQDKDVTENISKITDDMISADMRYDAILIDEGQDLDKEWLKFIVKMLRNPEHSHLLLASDGAQNLYNRKYTLKSVGIKATGRTVIMRENYRNTKQILDFAHNFLVDSSISSSDLTFDEEDNDFLINPETSLRVGEMPRLINCLDFKDEVEKIAKRIKELKQNGIPYSDMCILHPYNSYKNTNYLKIMEEVLKEKGIPCYSISKSTRTKSNFKLDYDSVKLSTIYSAKGLDFKVVFICGLNDGLVERGYNEAKKLLYVGMTRARDILNVTYSVHNDIIESLKKTYSQISINNNTIKTKKVENRVYQGKDIFDDEDKKESRGIFSKIKSLFNI
ncbi:Superfamily I DNA and RNA helicases [Tepidibacter thalassicus DSM 15285]|uniref:Superfamily I DNA and RNA helicases n=2 Tax=Tepidibacter TaxID=214904 RepID=A0A1M5PWG0_9FIRM|nr:Superfamily I DNA and RNA helicases [Tepidibacter thalassicus DSM 15285]